MRHGPQLLTYPDSLGGSIADITRLLRERRHISRNEDDDFSVMDLKEIEKMLSGTTEVLTMLLGAVAAVSLLVGGIGIMNIMLVSVTERTREIGIRLAVGAQERDVLLQFLVEAMVLSSLGGIVGILLALGASVLLANLMQVPLVFSPGIFAIAFIFSMAVGVIFGYFPARKAARLALQDAMESAGVETRGMTAIGWNWDDASRSQKQTMVCAQCHVEYYFAGPDKLLTLPWEKGTTIDSIEAVTGLDFLHDIPDKLEARLER